MKTIKYHDSFKYEAENVAYELQMKKPWSLWWLLLLLPLLLFVRCQKSVEVTCVDSMTGNPVVGATVSMDYTAHSLLRCGKFVDNHSFSFAQTTDSMGQCHFDSLECSVYSYVLYCLSTMTFDVLPDCYSLKSPVAFNFHYRNKVTLVLEPKLTNVPFRIVDIENGEEIAGASIRWQMDYERAFQDSILSDPAGNVQLTDIRECSGIIRIDAHCFGYADTLVTDLQVRDVLANDTLQIIKMRPLKTSFTFFVKHAISRQPLPGATALVSITSKSHTVTETVTTNVDGKGRGVFEDAALLSKVDIHASKIHYRDSDLVGDYRIVDFVKLDDDHRTVWLEPEPYTLQFQNRDSITHFAIQGVKNEIRITQLEGETSPLYIEYSNRQGYFSVSARESETIDIHSTKFPQYKDKDTHIASFEKEEIVYMQPNFISLEFRTVSLLDGSLLPDCTLRVQTQQGKKTDAPANSGNGVFTIPNLYPNDYLSIEASKSGYKTNNTKVSRRLVKDLMSASQSERDIPLDIDLPPCSAGGTVNKTVSGAGTQTQSFSLGKKGPGTFLFEFQCYSEPDRMVVYNCVASDISSNTPIYDTGLISTKSATFQTLNYTNPVVTVVVYTGSPTSSWEFNVHCP